MDTDIKLTTALAKDLDGSFEALVLAHQDRLYSIALRIMGDPRDAATTIMRCILQRLGDEVIHLGHNRSVDEVVTAALQENAQGIAISS